MNSLKNNQLKKKEINILISTDNRYLKPYLVVLKSLFKNNKNVFFNIYFAHFSDEDVTTVIEKLNKVIKNKGRLISTPVSHYPSPKLLSYLGKYKPSVYLKLFSLYFLNKTVEKILWLDGDVLICKNIEHFYNSFNPKKYAIMGTEEIEEENLNLLNSIKNETCYKTYDKRYLNVGVLLLSPSWFICHYPNIDNLESALEGIIISKKNYILPEQDLINILCSNNKQILINSEYNFSIDTDINYYSTSYKDIWIIHFTRAKPWTKYDRTVRFQRKYWKYGISVFSFYRFFKYLLSYFKEKYTQK